MRVKRLVAAFLACVLLAVPSALAADAGRRYDFTLRVNGGGTATVQLGDTVTVTVALTQRGADSITLYALQDRIIYNTAFFQLVEGSLTVKDAATGIARGTQQMAGTWAGWTGVYSNALSVNPEGDIWENPTTLVTFQLKTIRAGTSVLLHREHVMSTTTGLDEYESAATDATVIIKDSSAASFSDVQEGAWYYDAVRYVTDRGLFDAKSATAFGADDPMTRAMLVVALYRLEGSPDVENSVFTDIVKDTELSRAAAWAHAAGIVQGVGDNRFDPAASITREQTAAMFYRRAAYKKADLSAKGDLTVFTDNAKISAWARDALAWANGAKLVNGMGDGTVNPQGTSNRAQVAQVFYNFSK
ncbi:MAG: S-layer homology domain-containing protein [Clostridiales Family XIII bacterium]|jgi:hypothetical protein|nr:S-layer homology domain-containing protein [Clostridiales Family XIII bacterium]